ncbi:DUF1223 domain-containing protein [Algicella marina]|uniref:DUF1223 domain-containing protein n=1 Tax=Algicella marina TaxID=2683284 RepID=A0A6P1SXA2_9RHOB|nr:DUF1223 domain-containing protein [Algicella marina]QHQ34165.1 DUF1223 domain-containing protein [Algicella marina]
MIKSLFLPALVAIALMVPVQSRAEQPVLVELFTSQGCSSCPPADRMLGELVSDPRVIALSFHVDYWDYLGWKDTFASRAFTMRQQEYVGHTDRSGIRQKLRGKFTPEIVIQGTDSFIGHDGKSIRTNLEAHAGAVARASVTVAGRRAVLTPLAAGLPRLTVMLASVLPKETVAIQRGENSGRKISYYQVVTDLSEIGTWDGASEMAIDLPGTGPAVVFLQAGKGGPVLAAAKVK